MIRSRLDGDFSSLQSKEYVELFETLPSLKKHYFNHPYFLFECLNAFNKIESCFLFSVFEDDKLVGFDAFRRTKIKIRGFNVNCLVPGAYKIAEYNMPVINPGFYNVFFQELSIATIKESIFYHNCTPFFSEFFKREMKNSFVYSTTSNPILEDREDNIYKASVKKAGVRYLKVLKKSSNVETKHIENNVGEEILNSFFELHIKRWEGEGSESKFKQNVYKEIYRSLFVLEIPRYGQPVLSYIKSNNDFLAMHLGFIIGDSFLYQVPALNVDQKSKSSGTILIKVILDFLAEKKIRVFDMGYGMEEYKFRYMNEVKNYFSMVRFSNSLHQRFFKIKI